MPALIYVILSIRLSIRLIDGAMQIKQKEGWGVHLVKEAFLFNCLASLLTLVPTTFDPSSISIQKVGVKLGSVCIQCVHLLIVWEATATPFCRTYQLEFGGTLGLKGVTREIEAAVDASNTVDSACTSAMPLYQANSGKQLLYPFRSCSPSQLIVAREDCTV